MGIFGSAAKVYRPAAEVDLGPGSAEHYISPNVKGPFLYSQFGDSCFCSRCWISVKAECFLVGSLSIISAPRVAGLLVKIFGWVLELPVVGWFLLYILKKDNLINKVQTLETLTWTPFLQVHCSLFFSLFLTPKLHRSCLRMGDVRHLLLIFSTENACMSSCHPKIPASAIILEQKSPLLTCLPASSDSILSFFFFWFWLCC